ncbi:STAS/SEC14 domain-containing protein [Neptunicella marina]|uniref:STAS/SEC14 domain-containing protein n=1 Tax=Neptunicella marina TaxID=2125989 RepID=A0A8J6IUZ9_9ALTE|nr:STAS/SEC14 domain-containing protein [Neptunicella marina]MBC3765988.1 STAS/SEC14 domain-containing protein [Neptunicella marina]
MKTERHGLSIGIERSGDQFFLFFKATGKLTHQDYKVISPMLESAVSSVKQPNISALIDTTEFEGWELRAAWDDLTITLKHGNQFNKIAILGNKGWQEWFAKISSWFVSGEVRFFDKATDALSWLDDNPSSQ